MAIQWMSITI